GAHVGRAARGERHDEANWPVRPLLRLRGRDGDEESQERDDKAQLHHWKMVPLSVWLIDYPIDPSSVRLAVTPRSRSPSCRSPPISPSTCARFGSRHPGLLRPAHTRGCL